MKAKADIYTDDCSAALRVISDKTRLKVVEKLFRGPANVSDMVTRLGLDQSLLSHHLKVLRDHGIVESKRVGKQVWYSLSANRVETSKRTLNLGCCSLSFQKGS